VETLRGDTTTVLVAEGSGLLEGFVALGASRDHDTGGRVGEVYALYVQRGAWRSGAGSALHDAAIQALAKADLIPATLWVLDSNAPARSFYAHRGWRPEGAVKLDHRPGATLHEVRYRQDGTAATLARPADNLRRACRLAGEGGWWCRRAGARVG